MMAKAISQDDMLAAIDGMTVLELAELVDALKEKYNVTAAPVAVAAAPAEGAGNGAAEQTEFEVHITEVGQQKIQVIKAVREITGLGLKEAKSVVDASPGPVKEGVSKDEGDQIIAKLEEVGARGELK
jgi:large subunit ribosomal protein L7/L12